MQRPNPIPFYTGVIDWYSINQDLRTVSYKLPDQIGCTRKFAILPVMTDILMNGPMISKNNFQKAI